MAAFTRYNTLVFQIKEAFLADRLARRRRRHDLAGFRVSLQQVLDHAVAGNAEAVPVEITPHLARLLLHCIRP